MGEDESDEDEADDVDEATELANKMRAAGLMRQTQVAPEEIPTEDQKKN